MRLRVSHTPDTPMRRPLRSRGGGAPGVNFKIERSENKRKRFCPFAASRARSSQGTLYYSVITFSSREIKRERFFSRGLD